MRIRKAVHAGYCWGVERALDIVTDTAAAHPGETVRTLGPIIHNETRRRVSKANPVIARRERRRPDGGGDSAMRGMQRPLV